MHRNDIRPCRVVQAWICLKGSIGYVANDLFGHFAGRELQRNSIGKCFLERLMVQQAGMYHPPQQRFGAHSLISFAQDAIPYRIQLNWFCLTFGSHRSAPILLAVYNR